MLFSLTNPEVAILMMGLFLFAVLLGFPIAFTLMAMGIGFGYYILIGAIALVSWLVSSQLNISSTRGVSRYRSTSPKNGHYII